MKKFSSLIFNGNKNVKSAKYEDILIKIDDDINDQTKLIVVMNTSDEGGQNLVKIQ